MNPITTYELRLSFNGEKSNPQATIKCKDLDTIMQMKNDLLAGARLRGQYVTATLSSETISDWRVLSVDESIEE